MIVTASELTLLKKQAAQIFTHEQDLKQIDPIFTDWLNYQKIIVDKLVGNIEQDQTRQPDMASSELEDLKYWIKRADEAINFIHESNSIEDIKILNVKDFGAVGDGKNNDTMAFKKALNAASKFKATKIIVPNGTYLLLNPGLEKTKQSSMSGIEGFKASADNTKIVNANILIDGLNNISIEGGTDTNLLITRALDTAIQIINSKNIKISNLNINYTPAGYTTGQIIKIVNENQFDVAIDKDMIAPTRSYFREGEFKGMIRTYSKELQPDSLRPSMSNVAPHSIAPVVEHLEDNIYRFTIKDFTPVSKYYQKGYRIAYYPRTYGNHCIINESSDFTRLDNISIHSSSAMAILNTDSDLMFITNCKIQAKENSFVSTSADGIYIRNCMFGGYIANNSVKHIGDDFTNIHSLSYSAIRQDGNKIYMPLVYSAKRLKNAKRLGLMKTSEKSVTINTEFKIENVKIVENSATKAELEITLAGSIPQVKTRENSDIQDNFIIMENQAHGLVFNNNIFADGLSRVLIGGRNILFINNEFIDSLKHSFFVNIGAEFIPKGKGEEVCIPRNINFVNNKFNSLNKTIFNFAATKNKNQKQDNFSSSHMNFINNKFQIYGISQLPIFNVNDVYDLNIIGNSFEFKNHFSGTLINLSNSTDVNIINNKINGFNGKLETNNNVKNLNIL